MADTIGPLGTRMVRGSIAAMAGKSADLLISLAFGAVLTRVLSPDQVGEYFVVATMIAGAATLSRLGMHQATTRLSSSALAAGDRELARAVITRALLLVLTLSLFVAAIMGSWGFRFFGIAVFGSSDIAAIGGLAAVWIVAQSMQPVIAGAERSFHHIGRAALDESVLSKGLFLAALAIWWVSAGQGTLGGVVLLGAATAVLSLVVGGVLLARTFPKDRQERRALPVMILVRIGSSVALADASALLLGQASIWILGAMAPATDVALYGLATRLAALIGVPHLIVISVLPPIVAKLYQTGQIHKLEQSVRMFSTVAGITAFFAALVVTLTGRQLLTVVFGSFYGSATPILAVLALGSAVNVLSGPNGVVLIMTGHERAVAAVQASAALLMVGVMVLVTPIWGALGLAVAVSTGLVGRNLVLIALVRRFVGVNTFFSLRVIPTLVRSIRRR